MRGQRGSFLGFTYNNIHSSVFGITRVSNGPRFNQNVNPTRTDLTIDVPGADGQFYFGSTFDKTEFTINYAFDGVTETQLQNMKMLWNDKKIHDFIYDEYPYKIYSAKVTGASQIKHLTFEENGQRIYKGEGSFIFTCYFPYARSRYEYQEDYTIKNIPEWLPEDDYFEILIKYYTLREGSKNYDSRVYYNITENEIKTGQIHFNNQKFADWLIEQKVNIKNSDAEELTDGTKYSYIIYGSNRDSEYVNYNEWIESSGIPSKEEYGFWKNEDGRWLGQFYNPGDIPTKLCLWLEAPKTIGVHDYIIKCDENEIKFSIEFDEKVEYYLIDSDLGSIQGYDVSKNKLDKYINITSGALFELPIGKFLLEINHEPSDLKLKYYYI